MQTLIPILYGSFLVACCICMAMVFKQHPSKEQKVMQMVLCFICVTMVGYCIRINATDVEGLVISQKLIYLGGCHLYYFMLRFLASYCKMELPKNISHLLLVVNCFMTVVSFTMDQHTLLYKSYHAQEVDGFLSLNKEYGPLHTLYVVSVIVYCLYMIGIVLVYIYKNRAYKAWESLQLLMVVICPSATYALEKVLDPPFDIVPIGLMMGVLVLMYLMYFGQIYDLSSSVMEFVFHSVHAALIVVNDKNQYKGCNELAKDMFPLLATFKKNKDASDISEEISQLLAGWPVGLSHKERIYEGTVREISVKNKVIGKVIWLSDVTEERKHLELLENYQKELESEVDKKTATLIKMQEDTIFAFANIIESRDHITGGHVKRTSGYVNILINQMRQKPEFVECQDDSYVRHVCQAAPLHDIGKIGIPDAILNKNGKFEDWEYDEMKKHASLGKKILDKTLSSLEDKEYYELACQMAECHHEKWDGTGYPNGLKGEEIPLCARVMAVADVFDALTSKRPYKEEFPIDKAFEIIEEGKGKHFAPEIVDVFFEAKDELIEFYEASR